VAWIEWRSRRLRSDTGLDDDHRRPAAPTVQGRTGRQRRHCALDIETDETLQQGNGPLAVGVEEAEVACPPKAFGCGSFGATPSGQESGS